MKHKLFVIKAVDISGSEHTLNKTMSIKDGGLTKARLKIVIESFTNSPVYTNAIILNIIDLDG